MKKHTYKRKLAVGVIILFIGMGLAPGITNSTASNVSQPNAESIMFVQQFSKPEIRDNKEFIDIMIKQAQSVMTNEEKPMMPVFSKTYEFPFGTKITDVIVTHSDIKKIDLEKQISPVPEKQKLGVKTVCTKNSIDQKTYSSSEPYPNTWYCYTTGTGLNKDNDHVLFLSIHIYPARYIPYKNILQYVEQVKLSITYEKPETKPTIVDEYDLVVIAPAEFSQNLQQLVSHKNNYGMTTHLVALQDIYNGYPGRDNPEKIKYFIKHAIEEWNTHYVLLIGDIKKLPIRNTYASWWEPDILSDLYYADIYDSTYQFCSWDANGNNKFGEVNHEGYDLDGVDLYADVHIGRLACTDIDELEIVINKIITYEKETYGSSWFKQIILAGGDTFPPFYGADRDVFEGEITNAHVAQNLPDFRSTLLWTSKRSLNALTFNRAITKGAGFVSYAGHGFEHGWGTYKPNAMRDKLILYYMPFVKFLGNNEKLPIVFFDACLTAKLDFNIADLDEYYPTWIQFLVRFTKLEYDTSVFYPCFAWSFIKEEGGGAIATIGSTRTAYTWVNEHGVFAGAGYLDVSFFKAYEDGVTAGEMLTLAQNDYIDNVGMDYFTIEEFILLGDPSLRVGGCQN